jgi:hypothetical protein
MWLQVLLAPLAELLVWVLAVSAMPSQAMILRSVARLTLQRFARQMALLGLSVARVSSVQAVFLPFQQQLRPLSSVEPALALTPPLAVMMGPQPAQAGATLVQIQIPFSVLAAMPVCTSVHAVRQRSRQRWLMLEALEAAQALLVLSWPLVEQLEQLPQPVQVLAAVKTFQPLSELSLRPWVLLLLLAVVLLSLSLGPGLLLSSSSLSSVSHPLLSPPSPDRYRCRHLRQSDRQSPAMRLCRTGCRPP